MSERIIVVDTTLRAGEHAPGCNMSLEEKVRMARQLEQLGVDVIEAGSPSYSPLEFEAVQFIAKTIERSAVAAYVRGGKQEVERGWEAVRYAKRPRLHLAFSWTLFAQEDRKAALQEAALLVRHASSLCPDIQAVVEDAFRLPPDAVLEFAAACAEAGAATVSLHDTSGYSTPGECGALFRRAAERLQQRPGSVVGVFAANDLGLATANALEAVQNGARQIECSINGIGPRAGLLPLEEIVMIFRARFRTLGFAAGVKTEELVKTSRLLSSLTGIPVQRNKAVVGANAFSHEAVPTPDREGAIDFEPMTPSMVGIKHSALALGKHSTRAALAQRYAELGYQLSDGELDRAFRAFTMIAEQKREIVDEDLIALQEDSSTETADLYVLEHLQVSSGTNLVPTATVALRFGDQRFVDSATGDGPVDAAYRAIERIAGVAGKLTEYSTKSVSIGHDAMAEIFVQAEFDGVPFNGRAASTDLITGSARAYLEALNRAVAARKRKADAQPS